MGVKMVEEKEIIELAKKFREKMEEAERIVKEKESEGTYFGGLYGFAKIGEKTAYYNACKETLRLLNWGEKEIEEFCKK